MAMQIKAKLAAASMRWSVLDIVILHGSGLPAGVTSYRINCGAESRPAKCLKDVFPATPVAREYS
jgi:hypothetical protein